MSTHIQLYGRPLGSDPVVPPLLVEGLLPSYAPGDDYEGRLEIIGAIGKCTVSILSAHLPPGHKVFVDNFTSEVVVRWPGYIPDAPTLTAVPNGGFEDHENGWTLGDGWTVTANPGGGEGSYSAQHLATGSSWSVGTLVPCTPNTVIELKGDVQQGASSKNNAGGAVGLSWYDADMKRIRRDSGNEINSGSNSQWQVSTCSAAAPAGTAWVSADIFGWRRKQWRELWIDNLRWDHSYTVGSTDEDDYSLSIVVRDSAGREAYWSGVISPLADYLTSLLYPLIFSEAVGIAAEGPGVVLKDMPHGASGEVASIAVSIAELATSTKLPPAYTVPADALSFSADITELLTRSPPAYTAPSDPLSFVAAVTTLNTHTHPATASGEVIGLSASITGITTT